MINNFKFNVELVQKKVINTPLTLIQYDRAYKVTFYLFENGQPYLIKDNEKIQIDMALPNGKAYIASMGEKGITNVSENHFDLIVGREMTLGSGRGSFNVAVVDKESGITYRKGSNKYTIEIMGNALSEDVIPSEFIVTAKEELDESIEIAQDLISQSQSTANPNFNIKSTDWTSTTAMGTTIYTYTLKHNLNTTNIIVQSYTSDNINIDLPFKIIDNNSIKFTSYTNEAFKVIVSANYQAVSGVLASGIATEVKDARGNYGTLDSRLDNIDVPIGGRNYLLNSNFYNGTSKWSGSHSSSISVIESDSNITTLPIGATKCCKNTSTSATGLIVQTVNLEPNTEYTVSVWVYVPSSNTGSASLRTFYNNNGYQGIKTTYVAEKDEWVKISQTFTTNATYTSTVIGFGVFNGVSGDVSYTTLFKLEKGNKVTDWSLNPDDIDTKITTTKSTLEKLISDTALATKKALYPVNSIYLSMDSTNPNTLFGFGTWELVGQGRTLVGVDASDNDFKTVNKTGGSKTQTLNIAQLPHNVYIDADTKDGTANKWVREEQGSNWCNRVNWATNNATQESISIVQPYITCYIWKRKA